MHLYNQTYICNIYIYLFIYLWDCMFTIIWNSDWKTCAAIVRSRS